METILKLAIATLMLISVAHAAPEWITVEKAECINNGGEMKDGICTANWQDAGGICSAIGATLPSIGQFKGVITNCGGEVDINNNANNQAYQSYYKNKGFNSSGYYWATNTGAAYVASYAWGVYFYYGDDDWSTKSRSLYVRCVRSGR